MQYIIEVGRYIKDPISPFSIHMALSLFDRYMSYLSETGTPEMKEAAARDMEVLLQRKLIFILHPHMFNILEVRMDRQLNSPSYF